MEIMIHLELKVNVEAGRCNLNEIAVEVSKVVPEMAGAVVLGIVDVYQEEVVDVLCRESGSKAKRGLGSHEKKDVAGKKCRWRRFKRAGYWSSPKRLQGEHFQVDFVPAAIECEGCGKRLTPVLEALELKPYGGIAVSLEKKVMEAIADTSYRRGSHQLDVLGEIPVPKSTMHRWAARLEGPKAESQGEPFLLADGTGFKRQPGERGEVRLVLEMSAKGKIRPLGVWAGTTWEDIGKEVQDRLKGQPDLFIGDGEEAMQKWLGRLTGHVQRCQWHLVRDSRVILWHDHAPAKDKEEVLKKLPQLLAIEVPEEDVEMVSKEDKQKLREKIQSAEKDLLQMQEEFEKKGYVRAATYLQNARDHLFTHLRLWLETGIIAPKTASIIENMIRELVRRLKKVGWNWSDKGAAKMGQMVMVRRYAPDAWNEFWKKRMNLQGRCQIQLFRCEAKRVA
jgi:hypothetical protein